MVKNYESNIPKFKNLLQSKKANALEAVAMFVDGEIQVRVPVDQGSLKASYSYIVDVSNDSVKWGSNAGHALPQEKGTYKMDAQPHMQPSIDENRNRIENLAGRVMKF